MDESIEKYRALTSLTEGEILEFFFFVSLIIFLVDFVHCASVYGKIIISELYLDDASKTIKPAKLGGIAGGEKVGD